MQKRESIDVIAAKILKALLKESRTSFTEIAKDCKISVAAVSMRYKHLEKIGVIKGGIMQVNPYSLGYNCIGDIGINTSIEHEKAVIEFLRKKLPQAHVLTSFAKYNIGILVAKKNIEEWNNTLKILESNSYIKLADPLIWLSPTGMDHPENLEIKPLENKRQENTIEQNPTPIRTEQIQIDEIDRQIAGILIHNSRISFRKIAVQLSISTHQVIQRYNKLRGNVLTLSTITLDPKKLGYTATVEIFLKVKRSWMRKISDKILQTPNMLVFIRLVGFYDLHAIVAVEDFSALLRLQRKIRAMQGIELAEFFVREIWHTYPLNIFASLIE